MGLKAILSKPFAALIVWQMSKWKKNGLAAQQNVFEKLILKA